jgi:hypothetical protein
MPGAIWLWLLLQQRALQLVWRDEGIRHASYELDDAIRARICGRTDSRLVGHLWYSHPALGWHLGRWIELIYLEEIFAIAGGTDICRLKPLCLASFLPSHLSLSLSLSPSLSLPPFIFNPQASHPPRLNTVNQISQSINQANQSETTDLALSCLGLSSNSCVPDSVIHPTHHATDFSYSA